MDRLNIAVIGCGRIGRMHVENILTYFPEINIKYIVDKNTQDTWFSSIKSENEPNIFITDKVDVVLKDEEISAVVIAAPSKLHVELIKLAASYKKHIFCEKPVGFTVDEVAEAIAVTKNRVKFQVGLNRRFDKSFMAVKDAVRDKKIGDVHIVKITNRDPKRPNIDFLKDSGGLFLDFNVHDFDMIKYVTGYDINQVQAFGANLIDENIGKAGDIDTAVISMVLENGALASIDTSRESLYGYDQRLEVFGSRGSINAENVLQSSIVTYTEECTKIANPEYDFVSRFKDAYIEELRTFFNYLKTKDKHYPVNPHDLLKAVACAKAAQLSMQERRPVLIDEIYQQATNLHIEELELIYE